MAGSAMVRLIDDAELLRLAAEPPRDVAPVLRRANWFAPLVVLLAVAPALIAAGRASLPEETASWGLRALAIRQADRIHDWLTPGAAWPDVAVNWAPPLQAWLTAPLLGFWPPGSSTPLFAIACASVIAAIAVAYWFTDETGGARWAVICVTCLALHPQTLRLAQSGSPDALCFLLLIVTSWGFWRAIHGRHDSQTRWLLIGGFAWGLLLLAGGPLAFAFGIVSAIWLAWLNWRSRRAAEKVPSAAPSHVEHRASSSTNGQQSGPASVGRDLSTTEFPFRIPPLTLVVLALAGSVGCWWLALMAAEQGASFLVAWRLGQPGPTPLSWGSLSPTESWVHWLHRSAFLSGWWLVGLVSAIRLGRTDRVSPEAQLARWLLVWMLVAAGIRTLLLWVRITDPAVLRLWETFALFPATLLAAQGLDQVLRREASWQLVLLALMVAIGHLCWLATGRLIVGVIVGGSFGVLVLASAPLALGLRRSTLAWTEAEIRRWVAVTAVGTLCGHAAMGWMATRPSPDRAAWRRVQSRLRPIENVSLATLIVSGQADAPQLRYLMRALWPKAEHSRSIGWDPKLTETLLRERDDPHSRMVVVEWARNELRLQGDVGTGWQVTTLVEPEPYRDRRLAARLLSPAPR